MQDYAKKFEDIVRAALIDEGVCWDRLPDQVSGKIGSKNPCDFTAYKKPYYMYIECKTCQGDRLAIKSYISEHQWTTLLDKSKYPGVCAGYVVWFVNKNCIFYITAKALAVYYKQRKSFTPNEIEPYATPVRFIMLMKYPKLLNLTNTIIEAHKRKRRK